MKMIAELRSCAGSNPVRNVPEIRDDEDLWQWFWQEIRLHAFRRSTIPQKQFITSSSSSSSLLVLLTSCKRVNSPSSTKF